MNSIPTQYPAGFKSGFVAIVGAPNVGKSTLLNSVLGEKISITSRKPQTTRNRILGILHRPESQLIFIDTPGIHEARSPLNVRIVDTAFRAMGDVDLILVVIDAAHPDPPSEKILLKSLKKQKKPVLLALNKVDLIEKPKLLTLIHRWSKSHTFEEIIPISAKTGIHLTTLMDSMTTALPKGPPFFPEDAITDMSEQFIASEMIREKVIRFTGQEIPYSVAVTIDSFKEDTKRALVKIHARIHVERNSQKGIIIGKNGSKLKQIGEEARLQIERIMGTRVFLKLFVRVQKNWSKDTKALRRLGY
ncbi:GTPase Era [Thermodesulfobacteriota bacterium]